MKEKKFNTNVLLSFNMFKWKGPLEIVLLGTLTILGPQYLCTHVVYLVNTPHRSHLFFFLFFLQTHKILAQIAFQCSSPIQVFNFTSTKSIDCWVLNKPTWHKECQKNFLLLACWNHCCYCCKILFSTIELSS